MGGSYYFDENRLKNIFNELSRISSNILFSVKIEQDDLNTGKIILDKEKWEQIVSLSWNIKFSKEYTGKLYDKNSKWLVIFAES